MASNETRDLILGQLEGKRICSQRNVRLTQQWLERNIYYDFHEILFNQFPIALYEWLSKVTLKKRNFQGEEPKSCKSQLIQGLKSVDNTIWRAVKLMGG